MCLPGCIRRPLYDTRCNFMSRSRCLRRHSTRCCSSTGEGSTTKGASSALKNEEFLEMCRTETELFSAPDLLPVSSTAGIPKILAHNGGVPGFGGGWHIEGATPIVTGLSPAVFAGDGRTIRPQSSSRSMLTFRVGPELSSMLCLRFCAFESKLSEVTSGRSSCDFPAL